MVQPVTQSHALQHTRRARGVVVNVVTPSRLMEAHAQFAVKTTESTSLKKQAEIENESATSNATIDSIILG